MTQVRSYESPLRAEQMEQTRTRILEAFAEALADPAVVEVTVPVVARIARVSVRTVYRHFPTKEALYDAWGDWADEDLHLMVHSYPETIAELNEMVPELYRTYDENEPLVRALLSKTGREVRARTRRRRMRGPAKALEELTGELDEDARKRAFAVVYLLISAPAWQAMRDQSKLDGDEAGKAAAWAVRVLTEELRRNPHSIEDRKETPQ
jgi:AcrR family transcriptional regulator